MRGVVTSPKRTTPPSSHIRSEQTVRIIPTLYPPLDLFEGLAPPEDWDALFELESTTNDRLRDEVGDISLVPQDERVSGPGSTTIMAPLTHRGASRFSDGTYGVYYAGLDLQTAVAESAFSRSQFYSDSGEPASDFDMRAYYGTVDGTLHDVRGGYVAVHDPDNYQAPQSLARELRSQDSYGIAYDSVRNPGGECIAIFRPSIFKNDRASHTWQGPVFKYHWDGARVTKYFDYDAKKWIELPEWSGT